MFIITVNTLTLVSGHEASASARNWIHHAMNPTGKDTSRLSYILPQHNSNRSKEAREEPLKKLEDFQEISKTLPLSESWTRATL